jgi:hypothetical protein
LNEDYFNYENSYPVKHKYRNKSIHNLNLENISDDLRNWLWNDTEKPPLNGILKHILYNIIYSICTYNVFKIE